MQQHGSKYFTCRPLPRSLGWGQKVKIQLFQNMVMLHIKLNGIMNAATQEQLFCPQTLPDPGVESKGQNSTFSENGLVAY